MAVEAIAYIRCLTIICIAVEATTWVSAAKAILAKEAVVYG